jgi:hypothetical protein
VDILASKLGARFWARDVKGDKKRRFKGPCFTEIIILACWNIWKQRNNKIFLNIQPIFRNWKTGFISDVTLVKHRVKESIVAYLSSWIDNLL